MSAQPPASDAPASAPLRPVPQAWLDGATQIEAAARGLFAGVIDVLEGVESGTARLDAAIVARLDERSHALIQALNLARPPLDQPVAAASPTEPEQEQ